LGFKGSRRSTKNVAQATIENAARTTTHILSIQKIANFIKVNVIFGTLQLFDNIDNDNLLLLGIFESIMCIMNSSL